ncbi:hypothetical protein [Sphingomicrobium clamense]|uniref:Uncharacterized protein n=1 Tax=Sphingomicrobium clamense TaxID=2851013 RepID=A0ABS6V7J1_9SPHN|nr:hypothetical protein [Sphingomicrobium sp. B8]MBW0145545.1 hypothetical protein [Sphingomicrobium sp. B8]
MRRFACLFVALAATACSTTPIDAPSLETRPGELLDPRLPVEDPNAVQRAVSPSVRAQLDGLLATAQDGARVFEIMATGIVPNIEAAGEPGSESWTAATEQLSRLDASREPVARALADVDALATRSIAQEGWVNPSDRDAIAQTAERIAVIDARLAAQIDRLTGILNP